MVPFPTFNAVAAVVANDALVAVDAFPVTPPLIAFVTVNSFNFNAL
jgi:hypothetical protein